MHKRSISSCIFEFLFSLFCCIVVWCTQQLWLTHIAHAATVFEHPVTLIQMSALAFANDLHINDTSILPSLIIAPIIFGIHLRLFPHFRQDMTNKTGSSFTAACEMNKNPIWDSYKNLLEIGEFFTIQRICSCFGGSFIGKALSPRFNLLWNHKKTNTRQLEGERWSCVWILSHTSWCDYFWSDSMSLQMYFLM